MVLGCCKGIAVSLYRIQPIYQYMTKRQTLAKKNIKLYEHYRTDIKLYEHYRLLLLPVNWHIHLAYDMSTTVFFFGLFFLAFYFYAFNFSI